MSPSWPRSLRVEVRNNTVDSRFEAEVDGYLSVLYYVRRGPVLELPHTFVLPALRGRGVAEKLVRTALGYAKAEALQVMPSCSYVARFIEAHPEFKSLLVGH